MLGEPIHHEWTMHSTYIVHVHWPYMDCSGLWTPAAVEQREHCLACTSTHAGHVAPTKLKRVQNSTHAMCAKCRAKAHIVWHIMSARRFGDFLPYTIQTCNRNVTMFTEPNHSRCFLSTHRPRRILTLGYSSACTDTIYSGDSGNTYFLPPTLSVTMSPKPRSLGTGSSLVSILELGCSWGSFGSAMATPITLVFIGCRYF